MPAYNSGFVTGTNSIGEGGSLEPFVPVHERPAEQIQGGVPGEHYHLDAAEHELMQRLYEIGELKLTAIYEPMVEGQIEGDFLYEELPDGSIDIMVDFGGKYAT
jgi:hypothetical protein